MSGILLQCAEAFFATLAFAVMFDVPCGELVMCGLCGAVSQTIYSALKMLSADMIVCFFCAAAAVVWLSRLFANRRRKPVTIYLVTGIIPLVPGAGIYYTVSQMIAGNNCASADTAIITFKSAAAISAAIIIVLALPQRFCGKKSK